MASSTFFFSNPPQLKRVRTRQSLVSKAPVFEEVFFYCRNPLECTHGAVFLTAGKNLLKLLVIHTQIVSVLKNIYIYVLFFYGMIFKL